ncbi:DNA polymerase III subunit epsilon [Hoeflea prorocentri]|uniref:DNA polymerase III subunit epsilon n=1 Tax=Hoeflea prorocentri TaxID=1922333 RepID=A0A9X3UMK3_9HYPH|nr:DNA polymerase III subunit epsilon [Hoeflea prorocentri]MCY6383165.1 DNA polymerase III subunit epsilon [Hoeflea prorocentri]MDA5400965.1 DNA polymerase III subunit epsilon [Hoeflea prorocentri]
MREIIFDTETTGLDNQSDRVIEIGGVELSNKFPTGRTFHVYINAQGKKVHPEALAVHGITDEFLEDKPIFGDIIGDMSTLFDGAKLVAHNASFDIGFINAELARLGLPPVDPSRVVDTLALARRRHPMGPNSLDALCKRYGIDNSRRTKHGALLDAELLAEVYIEMNGGRQAALGLGMADKDAGAREESNGDAAKSTGARPVPLAARLSEEEINAHRKMKEGLGEKALWNDYAE